MIRATYLIEFESISGDAWKSLSDAIQRTIDEMDEGQTRTELFNIANTIDAHMQKLAAGVSTGAKAAVASKDFSDLL